MPEKSDYSHGIYKLLWRIHYPHGALRTFLLDEAYLFALGACRHFKQALRVDRPPSDLGFATQGSLPATQGQRSVNQVDNILPLLVM
jgi:hypothetical protein